MLTQWNAENRDRDVIAAIPNLDPAKVTVANLNLPQAMSYALQINADITAPQLAAAVAPFQTYNLVPQVITQIRAAGMSYYINLAATTAHSVGYEKANPPPPPKGPGPRPPRGYTCGEDAVALLFIGTAFLTLSVVSAGAGAVLALEAWAEITAAGSNLSGLWSIGHFSACGPS